MISSIQLQREMLCVLDVKHITSGKLCTGMGMSTQTPASQCLQQSRKQGLLFVGDRLNYNCVNSFCTGLKVMDIYMQNFHTIALN